MKDRPRMWMMPSGECGVWPPPSDVPRRVGRALVEPPVAHAKWRAALQPQIEPAVDPRPLRRVSSRRPRGRIANIAAAALFGAIAGVTSTLVLMGQVGS